MESHNRSFPSEDYKFQQKHKILQNGVCVAAIFIERNKTIHRLCELHSNRLESLIKSSCGIFISEFSDERRRFREENSNKRDESEVALIPRL
jgi:hypothetical protein